ncbi:carbohydrate kinase [Ancylomarina sp. 16SWW S1-10-2]|uniref:carbohydrate kinase family protein n=1 Tax=Ancylomarina sp. 16SWW S1-10-2 TaxID=2499681 RepID=UPI0012AD8B36|nr:carbohydrate kinase [Ancylomarina sp. 16SWW S1-10-2]MRT94505.1 carbohydrate kinase [Ancylomarina sp. 16SWW S1-10-2]
MKQIVCYGEVLWDMFPTGKKLGGAPLNVALRAQSLGNKACVISSIGSDKIGNEILAEIKSFSSSVEHIQISKHFSTSEVLVKLDKSGSASYEIKMPCAWDDIQLLDQDIETVKASDAFIYGSLIARSKTSRDTLLALLEKAKFKVFDVNLRAPHYTQETISKLMKVADFIKFNDDEIVEICANMGFSDEKLEACIEFIAAKTNTKQVCVTLGGDGAVFFSNNQFVYSKGFKVKVADTVGAGDSFLATLINKLLQDVDPQKAITYACAVGAIVASKSGANADIPAHEIEDLINQLN